MADHPYLGTYEVAGRSLIPHKEHQPPARERMVPMLMNPNPNPRRRVQTSVVKLKERFVAAAPHVKKPGVYLYSEAGMHGSAKYFPPGAYPDLSKHDFANRARSISIGPGTSISIFTENNFKGISTQYSNINATPFGIADLTIFSNAVKSMRIH